MTSYKTPFLHFMASVIGIAIASAGMIQIFAQSVETFSGQNAAAGWSNQNLGKSGIAGSYLIEGDVFELNGSGADVWGNADAFYYVFLPWNGDGKITARIDELTHTHEWAKAGVMLREELTEASAHAFVALSPTKGVNFLRRTSEGGSTHDDAHHYMRMLRSETGFTFQQRGEDIFKDARDSVTDIAAPHWVRLIRRGTVFAAYDSTDGIKWNWLGTERIKMSQSIYLGLAVTSHDNARLCRARFSNVSINENPNITLAEPQTGQGDGLTGIYHDTQDLTGNSITRVDPEIDFQWKRGAAIDGFPEDRFSIRWEGALLAQFDEPYMLHVKSDDRARLWLDGHLVIDEWSEHPETEATAMVQLDAARKYLLRLEYYENRGLATVELRWSSPSTPRTIIPQSQLFSKTEDRDGDGLPDIWERAFGLDPGNAGDARQDGNQDDESNLEAYKQGDNPKAARSKSIRHADWLSRDIGQSGATGAAEILAPDRIVVSGAGAQIGEIRDSFHFVYKSWSGDVEICAQIKGQENADIAALAGLMIRETLRADARHATLGLNPEKKARFLTRAHRRGKTSTDPGGADRQWLRLVREGNIITSYESADGRNWEWVATEFAALPDQVYIGLAVNSYDPSALNSATFSSIQLRKPSQAGGKAKPYLGSGDGLNATYFDGNSPTQLKRIDAQVNFDWDIQAPMDGISPDEFSVRWEGWLQPGYDEPYALQVISDDGARLWFNGRLVIDAWEDSMALPATAWLQMEAGQVYQIRLDHYERQGEAVAKLIWSSPSTPKQAIPQSQLYSSPPISLSQQNSQPSWKHVLSENLLKPVLGNSPSKQDRGNAAEKNAMNIQAQLTEIKTVLEVSGAQFDKALGNWKIEDSAAYSLDRRGYLEYEMQVPKAGIYRMEVEAKEQAPHWDKDYQLLLHLDDQYLGRTQVDLGGEGLAHWLTPWVTAGSHRIRIYWDNARKGKSLRVKYVRLQALHGPDKNSNGRPDWVDEWLSIANGIDVAPQHSPVSPVCIEGRGHYPASISAWIDGAKLNVKPGAGTRWYANVPLTPDQPAELLVAFEGYGFEEVRTIAWQPTDLRKTGDLVIRRGDALLLVVGKDAPRKGASPNPVTIEIAGQTQYQTNVGQAVAHQFEQSGQYPITFMDINAPGKNMSRTIIVTVVEAELGENLMAWTHKARPWMLSHLSSKVVLEADPRMQLTRKQALLDPSQSLESSLVIDAPETRQIVARLGVNGPILDHVAVQGFQIHSSTASGGINMLKRYDDQSPLFEMAVVLSPNPDTVKVSINIAVGGVSFDDGTVFKDLIFDELGQCMVRFAHAPMSLSASCHRLRAHQYRVFLGQYE